MRKTKAFSYKLSAISFRKIKNIFLSLIVFLLIAVCCLLSADVYALDANKKILPNGLTVLHSEKHNLPIVMITVIVKAGLLDESKEKAGLAYLTAELLDEGTKNRKSSEISEEIEFIGAGLGASAGSDYTTITLSVLKKT